MKNILSRSKQFTKMSSTTSGPIDNYGRQFHSRNFKGHQRVNPSWGTFAATMMLTVGGLIYLNAPKKNLITEMEAYPIWQSLGQNDLSANDEKKQILFTLFDSRVATQKEFIDQMRTKQIYQRICSSHNIEIVHLDVANQDINFFDQKAVSKKDRPTFFMRANNSIHKLPADHFNKDFLEYFEKDMCRLSTSKLVWSIKDLSESLREGNVKLDDMTVVFCNTEWRDQDKQDVNSLATNFLRHESSNQILEVRDEELAEKLKMKPGKFYCYYKPSYINGFEQYQDRDINFDYLQAYEGVCRDELTLNQQAARDLLEGERSLVSEKFVNDNFDKLFSSSYSVQWVFNPNMRQFRRKYKGTTKSKRPMLFVYSPALYMSRYVNDFTGVLKQHQEVFDIYYCNDQEVAKEFFYLKEFPEIIPFVVLIDPSRKTDVRAPKDKSDILKLRKGQPIKSDSYMWKTRRLIMFNKIGEDLSKLIEEFIDDESAHFYQSEKRRQQGFVKTICSEDFEKHVVADDNVKQCIIEVFKHDCPSCAFNGKVYNVFSRKLALHGYDKDLPTFRLSIDNHIPWLGNFGYSPIYFYVKKDAQGKISEVFTLDPPQKANSFIEQIANLTGLQGFSSKIRIKPRDQVVKHIRLEDLAEDFDVDFDLVDEE